MIDPRVFRFVGVELGSPLPKCGPFGEALAYHFADSEPCCADCANSADVREAPNWDKQWTVTHARVHWEGPPEVCAHCNAEIESAYGEVEDYDADNEEAENEVKAQRAMS